MQNWVIRHFGKLQDIRPKLNTPNFDSWRIYFPYSSFDSQHHKTPKFGMISCKSAIFLLNLEMTARPINHFCSLPGRGISKKNRKWSLGTNIHEFSGSSELCSVCIAQHGWVVHFCLTKMARQTWFLPIRYQLPKGTWARLALQCFCLMHRVGRTVHRGKTNSSVAVAVCCSVLRLCCMHFPQLLVRNWKKCTHFPQLLVRN